MLSFSRRILQKGSSQRRTTREREPEALQMRIIEFRLTLSHVNTDEEYRRTLEKCDMRSNIVKNVSQKIFLFFFIHFLIIGHCSRSIIANHIYNNYGWIKIRRFKKVYACLFCFLL